MEGGFCVNDWLIREGLLTLKTKPGGPRAFDERLVDWSATRAWAWGGFHGRIFLNLEGREPQGRVPAAEEERFLDELTRRLEALPMGNRVLRPTRGCGDRPDLMVYFGDLRYRAIASVGNPDLFTVGNDTGPDDANHSRYGTFIWRGPGVQPGRREGLRLIDVAPTVLALFGLAGTEGAEGRAIPPAGSRPQTSDPRSITVPGFA
jgi:predicted AlkP superfamily phosphohydrolase/phosphomutase